MKRYLIGVVLLVAGAANAQTGIDPVYPAVTGNMNVRFIYENYQLFSEEVALSITKGAPGTLSHDSDRWLSYIAALEAYAVYWQSKNTLDWPVTHGKNYELDNPIDTECEFKSNQAACDLATLIANARDELVISASAHDMPMHLLPADLARQQSYWNAMRDFITTFMLVVQPLDGPVTSAEESLGLTPGGTVSQ